MKMQMVKVQEDVHLRLKMEAARRKTTMGDLIQVLLDESVGKRITKEMAAIRRKRAVTSKKL